MGEREVEAILYFIDGERAGAGALLKLDPNRIKSVNVMKKSEILTSLYGEKAKNGVIMIETKK